MPQEIVLYDNSCEPQFMKAVSRLSAREKSQAVRSETKRVRIQRLLRISQQLLVLGVEEDVEQKMAEMVCEQYCLSSVAVIYQRSNIVGLAGFGAVIQFEDRKRIFEMFYRAQHHSTLSRGTGVGLSYARRATEAHRGSIWVTSNAGNGTVFHISLPRPVSVHHGEKEGPWQTAY